MKKKQIVLSRVNNNSLGLSIAAVSAIRSIMRMASNASKQYKQSVSVSDEQGRFFWIGIYTAHIQSAKMMAMAMKIQKKYK
jgi:hypothetical protein